MSSNRLLHKNKPQTILEKATYLLCNLCRDQFDLPYEITSTVIPLVVPLIRCANTDTVANVCWTLSFIAESGEEGIDSIIEHRVVPRLIKLLNTKRIQSIIIPTLRTLGDIATGN